MIPTELPPDFTTIKAIGGTVGASLSLIYVKPSGWRDMLSRLVFGAVSGFVFAFYVHDQMKWTNTWESWLASSVLVGGFAWIVAGVGVRILKHINKFPKA